MFDSRYRHIVPNERGVPMIAGRRTKVRELALAQRINGWDALELHEQFPHLSMSQIHSALAYFWDHRDALEVEILKILVFVDKPGLKR